MNGRLGASTGTSEGLFARIAAKFAFSMAGAGVEGLAARGPGAFAFGIAQDDAAGFVWARDCGGCFKALGLAGLADFLVVPVFGRLFVLLGTFWGAAARCHDGEDQEEQLLRHGSIVPLRLSLANC